MSAAAVHGDVVVFGGNVELAKINAGQPRNADGRQAIHHEVVGEIRQRVAKRRELPIEDRSIRGSTG